MFMFVGVDCCGTQQRFHIFLIQTFILLVKTVRWTTPWAPHSNAQKLLYDSQKLWFDPVK